MKKAFFFDRDGTVIKSTYRWDEEHGKMLGGAALNLSELSIISNSREVVDYVIKKGFVPIIITNQPDFLKQDILLRNYEQITTEICNNLGIQRSQVFECFHKEGFSLECCCRKPKPGLFLMAKGVFDLNFDESWMIGDSWKDIEAAYHAGIPNTIFLLREYIEGEQEGNEDSIKKLEEKKLMPKYIIKSLKELYSLPIL